MRPTVSVALPAFNGERFIGAQLASIVEQTVLPDEIIVADDGSSDSTLEIVRDFARTSPVPVTVVANDHIGLSSNLETALMRCSGELIALSDQDDLWDSQKVHALVSAFDDPRLSLWFSDAELIDDSDEPQGQRLWPISRFDADALRAVTGTPNGIRRLIHGGVWGCTMAFRRGVLDVALPFPAELSPPGQLYFHDGWMTIMAYACGAAIADVRPLMSYRVHDGQTSRTVVAASVDIPPTRVAAGRRLSVDLARAELVLGRLGAGGARIGEERSADVEELARWRHHLRVRAASPGWPRTRAIIAQTLHGDYRRYGRGLRTALADVAGIRGSGRIPRARG